MDTLHTLTYSIKDAWRKKQVVSVLFLDIEGAFPNAVNETQWEVNGPGSVEVD